MVLHFDGDAHLLHAFGDQQRDCSVDADCRERQRQGGEHDQPDPDRQHTILLDCHVAEQEGAGESLMSRDFLSQVIRSYGSGLQDFVTVLSS